MPHPGNYNRPSRYITLCVAEFCNLSCTYCYEHHKATGLMSFETAKQILDKEFQNIPDDGYLCLEFFGGEPFLNFELIKAVTHYVESVLPPAKYVMFATTNGTLIHGEIQTWLLEHPMFSCSLSLDGTKEMHDTNRSHSFDDIDLSFFARNYPDQAIKMTVSRETLPKLCEGVIFCHEQGFPVSVNLAFGPDWSGNECLRILEAQLTSLIHYYMEHPDIKPCSMLNFDIAPVAKWKEMAFASKWCGSGTAMHTYDANGQCYSCQFFMPITLGEERAKILQKTKLPENIPLNWYPNKCRECCLLRICPMCYGANFASTGDFFTVEDSVCATNKMIMRARACFRAKQLQKGLIRVDDDKEQALIESILMIQEML